MWKKSISVYVINVNMTSISLSKFSMQTSNMKTYLLHQYLEKPRSVSTMEEFGAISNVHAYGKTYTLNAWDDALNFDHVITIGCFLINQMRHNKLPLKKTSNMCIKGLSMFSMQTSNMKVYMLHQGWEKPRPVSPWISLEKCLRYMLM